MRRYVLGMVLGSGLLLAGCTPPAPGPVDPPKPAGGKTPTSGTTSTDRETQGVQLVSMKVEMHCPFGCYPAVKETLEEIAGVESVELAKQKAEDAIDDPRVFIKLNGDFDSTVAIAALEKKGYKSEMLP